MDVVDCSEYVECFQLSITYRLTHVSLENGSKLGLLFAVVLTYSTNCCVFGAVMALTLLDGIRQHIQPLEISLPQSQQCGMLDLTHCDCI